MRKLIYFVAVSLDGFIAGPDGRFDFFPMAPGYLQELAAEWGDGFPTAWFEATGTTPPGTKWDTVVMGRRTYEPALAAGIERPYEHLETYVYSRTLDPADHPGVHVVSTDPVAHVRVLKAAEGGDLWLCGGGSLAATLLPEIDRLVLKLNPVVVGDGIGLFDGAPFDPVSWTLVASRTYDMGVTVLTFDRAGSS